MSTQPDNVLLVAIGGVLAGTLTRSTSATWFRYNDSYGMSEAAPPLSTRWPPDGGEQEHLADKWIANLLPEDPDVRAEWRRACDTRSRHPFDLLATRIGLDCAGAVQFAPDPAAITEHAAASERTHLTPDEVNALVASTLDGNFDIPDSDLNGYRFTLAGTQTKIALGLEPGGDRWYLPSGNEPSTHIVKPMRITKPIDEKPRGFPNLVVVEHLTMATARGCGMSVASTQVRLFGDVVAIVVGRYDRRIGPNDVQRLHQEDLCQALDRHPRDKFEELGGPSAPTVADKLGTLDGDSVRRFFEALVFNWVVGGTDAHAKNYSLLLLPGVQALAPMYDLISALPYAWPDDLDRVRLVMRAGARGQNMRAADNPQAWRASAALCGVRPAEALASMERIVGSVASSALAAYDALEPEFADLAEATKYVVAVEARAATATRVVEELAELAG